MTTSGAAGLDEAAARAELCRVGRSLFERGYVHATAGNLSVRLDDGSTLITPTDACLGFLQAADLVLVDPQGRAHGLGRASKTLVLHRRLQAADPAARCIIHTHSTHCVALTLVAEAPPVGESALPPITPYFVMKVGPVPRLPYRRPGDPVVGDLAVAAIEAAAARQVPIRALLLDRLGPVVWNTTPAAAMATLEELEETARLWLLARTAGATVAALTAAPLQELDQVFGARW
jgi:3-dehydro-4-phosphotetronate decarboxylase